MTTREQTFEEAIAEYIARCHESVGKERNEGQPPGAGTPYPRSGPPFEAAARWNDTYLLNYANSIGDLNPLYRDPEYAKQTRYGSMIAPGPSLIMARRPGGQGPTRPGGYPVGDFFSGGAWEFYDVVHVGTSRVRTSKTTSEFFEKQGSQGQLLFLIEEIFYHDAHNDLLAKCYGTLILVPIKTMGSGRAMSADKVGEHLMYSRKASQYTQEDFTKIDKQVAEQAASRRGANTLYVEDVEIGDKLGPYVIPPWTLQDQLAPHLVIDSMLGNENNDGSDHGFERTFHNVKERFRQSGGKGFVNPATNWPYGSADEHTDAVMAAYRGQSLPFDGGQHRHQLPHQLIANWMGDEGFVRRYQLALRRPVYYGDATMYSGEVVKKWTEVQTGEKGDGAVPGKATYHSVGIKLEGTNQVGQTQIQGSITVYLPSRKDGPVQLPVPHLAKPPYIAYEKFYRDWYQ